MAYTTINKSSLHFNTKLYTGNGTAIGSGGQAITGVGFQPDWTWIKLRNGAAQHVLFDVVRGVTKRIYSSTDSAESTNSETLTAFGTDGFTLGNNAGVNENSDTYVAWNWKAGNAQGSSNTDGSINTTYTSVNTTAGFSISQYTGNGSGGATVGHGLGVVPGLIFIKNLSSASTNWGVYHKSLGGTKALFLDLANQADTNIKYFNNTDPTNQVFSLGTYNDENANGENYIAYCFAEKAGYSKFGSYTGNGNADGTFVYTGFKPAWIMIKCSSHGSNNWVMLDNKREGFNPDNDRLYADSTSAESDTDVVDILSNGFKNRFTGSTSNGAQTYVFMAFAAEPLVANVGGGVPATAV